MKVLIAGCQHTLLPSTGQWCEVPTPNVLQLHSTFFDRQTFQLDKNTVANPLRSLSKVHLASIGYLGHFFKVGPVCRPWLEPVVV